MLEINHELKELIPPLQKEEYQLLEKSILEEGCRDKLIVWNNTIIDGHNRYEICNEHNIPFQIESMEFKDISEVKKWMIDNQLARRNLTDSQRRYFIGKRYEEEKKITTNEKGNNQYRVDERQSVGQPTTSQKIAEENNISHRTVERNADYSKAIDNIQKEAPEIAQKILSEEIKLNNKEILNISREEPEQQKKVIDLISTGQAKRVDEAKRIIDPEIVRKYEEKNKQIEKEHKNHRLVASLINEIKFLDIDNEAIEDYLNLVAVESFKTDFVKNCDRLIDKLNEMKSHYSNANKIRRVK